jgi:hypothetical protein
MASIKAELTRLEESLVQLHRCRPTLMQMEPSWRLIRYGALRYAQAEFAEFAAETQDVADAEQRLKGHDTDDSLQHHQAY